MPRCRLWSVVFAGLLISGFLRGPHAAAAESRLSPVEISFSAKVASSLSVKGSIVFRPAEGGAEPIRVAVTSLAPLSLKLAPDSKWEVSADLPGFWAPRKALAVGSPDQSSRLSLDVWPMGTISGVVKVKEKDISLPRQLLVKTLSSPDSASRPVAPQGALDCPVDKKGVWKCSLPASTFDLAISAEGLTPAYRWSVQVPAGKTLSLGTVELQRGASVAGWVTVDDGAIEPGRCLARLSPLVAGGASLRSVSDLSRTAIEREIRKDGFLQLTGLAPGTYVLEVRQPGYPPVKVSPVRVDPGMETFLGEPLILKKPLDLVFEVRPPLDWLGHAWHARVFRTSDPSARPMPVVFEAAVNEEGRFIVPDQSSGSFKAVLLDSLGNRLYSSDRQVDGPGTALQTLEVALVTVLGRLKLGDEPLAASLWFGGQSGESSVKMESDTEGRFHGVLPREGLWRIEVEAAEPVLQTWTRADVQAGRSGKASLDIELPDTRVFGRVVDEQGRPVEGADVILQGESLEQVQQTGGAGTFDARGLPEGSVWLGASSSAKKSASGRTFVSLVDGRAVGPLELRLRPVQSLTGTVLSPRGPVAGSRVMVLSRLPGGGGGIATTSPDGAFTVELPQVSPRVVAIVSSPGFALRAFDAATEGKPLSLTVTEEGGWLEIVIPGNGEDLERDNLTLAVLQNGLPVPVSVLNKWAQDQGQPRTTADGRLRAPNVAPGEYRVCLVPQRQELALLWGAPLEGATCDSGTLAPGATLSLKP
jgi:hypothetical protein